MTTRTSNCIVLAIQNKSGLCMIEACVRSHFPGIRCVAGQARDFDVSVRRLLGNAETKVGSKQHDQNNGFPDQ